MSAPEKKTIQALYESLAVVRKGSEDDFELRASSDQSIWGVRLFDENPNRPTWAIYSGPNAKELACDSADFDLEEDDDEEEEDG